jgi:hypothetical protein
LSCAITISGWRLRLRFDAWSVGQEAILAAFHWGRCCSHEAS